MIKMLDSHWKLNKMRFLLHPVITIAAAGGGVGDAEWKIERGKSYSGIKVLSHEKQ